MTAMSTLLYWQSERFNLKLVEEDGKHFVHVWTAVGTHISPKAIIPIIRVLAFFTTEEHDNGTSTIIYILEVDDCEKFRMEAAQGSVQCLWDIGWLDESAMEAYRTFCTTCLPRLLGMNELGWGIKNS